MVKLFGLTQEFEWQLATVIDTIFLIRLYSKPHKRICQF